MVLQVLMYYNAHFDVVYFFLTLLVSSWKISFFDGEDSSGIMLLAITIAWALLEYLRLTLGYSGNLRESVGRTIGSLLLSLGSLGIAVYFILVQANPLPFDVALNGIFLVLVILEVLWLIYNTRNFVKTQTTRFYLYFDRHGALLEDRGDSMHEDMEEQRLPSASRHRSRRR